MKRFINYYQPVFIVLKPTQVYECNFKKQQKLLFEQRFKYLDGRYSKPTI